MSQGTRRVLVVSTPMTGQDLDAARLLRRVELLGRVGGGHVLGPSPASAWPLTAGVRHIRLQAPLGADPQTLATELADRVGPALDRIRPQLVHVMGVTAAVPVLMRRRGEMRVVVEPGVTPSMWLRAKQPDLPAARLADLVSLEDKALARADAVIARSTVEAATLVRRGVPSSAVIPLRDPAPALDAGPLPALPHLVFVEGLSPWSGWQELLDAVERVKVPWRLTMVIPDDGRGQAVRQSVRRRGLEGKITIARQDELEHRMKAARLVICPLRPERAVLAGAVTPAGAHWSLGAGRPLIASDLPAIRAYCGPAARYFDAGNPGALAEAITELLSAPEAVEALVEKGARIREGADPLAPDQLLGDLWRRLQAQVS